MGNNSSSNSSFGAAPQTSSGQSGFANSGGASGGSNQSVATGGFQGKGDTAATSSGAYPNLQQYMTANQNWTNQQGQGLGQEVAGNLNQQGQQAQQNTQNAFGNFENQGSQWQQNTQNAANAFNQGIGNAAGFVQNNPQALQQAGQALGANYQGPQSLEGANPNLQQQSQNYQNEAQQTQTEGGRFNLLQQMFGGNNYTSGQQNLDQSLLQTNPQNQQQLQGAFQQATQQQQNLQNTQALSQQQAQNWGQFGQQTQQQAQQALNSNINTQAQAIQQQYQQQTAAQAANQAALTSGNISQALATQLGLSNMGSTYGVNAANYMNNPNITLGDVGTQQQYSQLAALGQLAGTAPGAANAASTQALQQDIQNGTAGTNVGQETFNNAGFQSAVAANQANYNAALQPLLTRLNKDKQMVGFGQQYDPTVGGQGGLDTMASLTAALPNMGATGQSDINAIGTVNDSEQGLYQAALAAYGRYNPTQGINVSAPTSAGNTAINTPTLASMMPNGAAVGPYQPLVGQQVS